MPSRCHAGRSWGNTSWAERTCLHCVINDHESSMINVGSYFSGFWVVYKQCPSGIKRLSRVVICRSMHFINIMVRCCLARSCRGTNSRANRTHHACVMCITGPAICGLCMFVIADNEIVFSYTSSFTKLSFAPPLSTQGDQTWSNTWSHPFATPGGVEGTPHEPRGHAFTVWSMIMNHQWSMLVRISVASGLFINSAPAALKGWVGLLYAGRCIL